jgi:hypothetical protein
MPFCFQPRGAAISWLQCDQCNRWLHVICANRNKKTKTSFRCQLCPADLN